MKKRIIIEIDSNVLDVIEDMVKVVESTVRLARNPLVSPDIKVRVEDAE